MPTLCSVKFSYASRDLWFDTQGLEVSRGDAVICETERGQEYGRVKSATVHKEESELASLIGDSALKPVIRLATPADDERQGYLQELGEKSLPEFERLVGELKLPMKPIGVEYLFGNERAICYFVAENRVDFRQLARELSACFGLRVDMRQIGAREQASIMGGIAHCGQEYCCSRLGQGFGPVSIRMAKDQDLPLNSPKISGACGRLMCCLRYEDETYRDFKRRAPKKNAPIETPLGKASVAEFDMPREAVGIKLEDKRSFKVPLACMECSKAAQHAGEGNREPCRPDTVSLEALKSLDSPQVKLALAQLEAERERDELAWMAEDDFISLNEDDEGTAGTAHRSSLAAASSEHIRGLQPRRRRRARSSASSREPGASRAQRSQGQRAETGSASQRESESLVQRSSKPKASRRRHHRSGAEAAQGAQKQRRWSGRGPASGAAGSSTSPNKNANASPARSASGKTQKEPRSASSKERAANASRAKEKKPTPLGASDGGKSSGSAGKNQPKASGANKGGGAKKSSRRRRRRQASGNPHGSGAPQTAKSDASTASSASGQSHSNAPGGQASASQSKNPKRNPKQRRQRRRGASQSSESKASQANAQATSKEMSDKRPGRARRKTRSASPGNENH